MSHFRFFLAACLIAASAMASESENKTEALEEGALLRAKRQSCGSCYSGCGGGSCCGMPSSPCASACCPAQLTIPISIAPSCSCGQPGCSCGGCSCGAPGCSCNGGMPSCACGNPGCQCGQQQSALVIPVQVQSQACCRCCQPVCAPACIQNGGCYTGC